MAFRLVGGENDWSLGSFPGSGSQMPSDPYTATIQAVGQLGSAYLQSQAARKIAKSNQRPNQYTPVPMQRGVGPAVLGPVAGAVVSGATGAALNWAFGDGYDDPTAGPVDTVANALGVGPAECAKWVAGPSGRLSPIKTLMARAPNGSVHIWRHMGSPILYSGDVAHVKRVTKLLGRASRKVGRKSRR